MFVFLFVSSFPLNSLFSPSGYFNFDFLVLVGSLLWSQKIIKDEFVLGGCLAGGKGVVYLLTHTHTHIFSLFFPLFSSFFSFFSLPLPCSVFVGKMM